MDRRKKILMMISAIMVCFIIGIVAYFGVNSYLYVSTEDAKVSADIVKLNAPMSGKLVSTILEEGTVVKKDQIVARIETQNLPENMVEKSIVRAPMDGIIIKKQGTVGELETAGQTLGMLVDPDQLYINANIEETDLSKIALGQKVDVKIDQYKGVKLEGEVISIGEASNSTFSLLSASGSTFTKVVQKVPVHISVNANGLKLRPGINAVVKVHIR